MSNRIANSYFEKNKPSHQQKPGPNASNHEVTQYLTNKYVDRKWASDDWSHDPAWLYENKPKKFAKYISWYKENCDGGVSVNAAAFEKKGKKGDSSDDEPPKKQGGFGLKAPTGFTAPKAAAAPAAPVQDLLSMDSPAPAAAPAGSNDLFNDMFSAPAAPKQDDGFSDF